MKIKKKNRPKKIILGGPPTYEKMTVEELKALSRQVKLPKEDEIISLSRNLRHNLTKAKFRMMDSLRKSNVTQDVQIYECLNKSCPSTPSLSEPDDYEEYGTDDCSSVSSTSSSLPLMTHPSGSSGSQKNETSSTITMANTLTDIANIYSSLLYTPFYNSMFDMNLLLQSALNTAPDTTSNEATEDQINSWLQRGGGGTISPIASLATDQELADLLDFDS
ncbi:hypothetical protein G6F45_012535 [Rhizopus arrhizus]|uniref:Uncharacterized protein n=1 Tax=Rhizopus delemar TaxID=936053 RepID=A0A9P6YJ20_9FUNG|nr:hypothetical protein G6F43_002638 [Rhizopus delemar]KAG1495399.1 hypothetical protein G6F52_013042 [Rhizopus delemar]KAG1549877.1 hypothetical protein G6F50_013322 [Rhizopus delemar]KAG1582059.1 hypothetical protein G6F48_009406 [Rhizopus delemar]KAG1614988.1 hypothetical protein G6F45_012535 [Rhizopus arrhizus]